MSNLSNIDDFINEATTNIRSDRKRAQEVLAKALEALVDEDGDIENTSDVLPIAKILETLQRSNEQLVKMTGMLLKEQSRKQGDEDADLTEEEGEDIYDVIVSKDNT